MIREKLLSQGVGEEFGFRWRGQDVTRIEALSDAVFGFAITLLVVSLEVPQTFDELLYMMRGFVAFAICFALLMLVWYQQYIFFRRYGMRDTGTIVLNAALLFVVLFYIYPLKFVWNFLTNLLLTFDLRVRLPGGEMIYPVAREQAGMMMIVFGVGYVAVFAVFTLLYLRAYRKREELELNQLELFDTRTEIESLLLQVAIGLVSLVIASVGGWRFAGPSGWVYALIGPVLTVHGRRRGKRRRRMEADIRAEAPEPVAA
jgi:uncharacterized membrane protein